MGSSVPASTATPERGRPLRTVLVNPYLSIFSRLVLGGVFLYAGVSKVFDAGG